MEDKEQKIKISFDTNADDTAKKVDGLTTATDNTSKAQKTAAGSSSDLSKNLQNLDTPINSTIKGMGGMLKTMWAIVANPIGAILAAVAVVLFGLYSIFKSFQPLVDKVEQSLAALGAVFNVVKNALLAVFTGTKSLSEAFTGLGGDMSDAADRTERLVKAQQDLEDVMKSQEVTTARNRAEINKLNVELRNRTKTDEERLAIADKIVQKENADYQQRKKIVDEEVRIAREAIAIKAQFTEDEIDLLKRRGDATKELAESRGGNYDEEYDALNKARIKAIGLEDEVTVNIEKAYSRRDKLQDDQQAKRDKELADKKSRNEKAAKIAEEAEKRRLEIIKLGIDAENAARKANEDINDKTDEEKLARQKQRALDEIELLRQKGVDVTNLLIYNNEKYNTLEDELRQKRIEEKKEADKKQFDIESEAKDKQVEQDLAFNEKLAAAKLTQKKAEHDSLAALGDAAINAAKSLFGKNKAVQKAIILAEGGAALGKVAINTVEQVSKDNTASPLTFGMPWSGVHIATGALGAASIIANTSKALQALGGGSAGSLNSSGNNSAAPTSAAPQVSFQASSENQIGNTVANKQSEAPIQAYVVGKDVTTQQSLDNNKITSNSI